MQVDFGGHTLELGSQDMGDGLTESNDILHDADALRERFAKEGYLLIRGLQNRDKVLDARRVILEHMARHGAVRTDRPLMDAYIPAEAKPSPMQMEDGTPLSRHPAVLGVLESDAIFDFFRRFYGREALTFTYKWLRTTGSGRAGGAHFDAVYVGGGSRKVMTVWTPFGDLTPDMGTLAILTGSHNLPSYEKIRQTYGQADVDRDRISGDFSNDPVAIQRHFGGQWRTTSYKAGDVIVFGLHTMHKATTNLTDRWRISCDTRFQPADEPVDSRWGGDSPRGHYNRRGGSGTPDLAGARKLWNL